MSARDIVDKLVQSRTHDLESHQVVAKVTRSDDMNNVCDIIYVDKGKLRNKDNVPVKVYGTGMDWFPTVGELVVVHLGRHICEIVSRFVSNFGAEILPAMSLEQDIHSDFVGGPIGGTCTGL